MPDFGPRGTFSFSCQISRCEAAKREGLLPLDQVHVVLLDEPDVVLPFVAEAIPGLDHVAVVIRQVVLTIEHEGGGYAFAGAGGSAASSLKAVGHFDDFLDLPGQSIHGYVLLCCA